MKSSLETRILIFSLLMLTLTIAVNTGLNIQSFRHTYRDGILQRSQALSHALKAQLEGVVNLGLPLQEIAGVSKHCQDIVNNDPEIGYCLVEDSAGQLLYHSDSNYPVMTTVTYVGNLTPGVSILQSKPLGKIYDYGIPIYDFDEKVVGRVHIGFQDQVLDDLVMDYLRSTMVVLMGAFAANFIFIILFLHHNLVLPIRRLCDMAVSLAARKFDAEAPVLHTRELSMLGKTLTDMAASLHKRDVELNNNCQELEQTNLELQKSYESLESISSELGRSREMYRSLFEDASDAILICDQHDNLIIVNKAAELFFGIPKTKVERKNYFSFMEMINCRDIEQQFEIFQTVKPGVSKEMEIRFWREADQCRVVGRATTSVVVGKDGRRLVQIIVRDATREEEIRLGLERTANEMERLNQMKNSFLGLVSHELKTPLTIIMGYAELLLSEREYQLDNDTLDMIRHIARASDRLSDIVRDMVDASLIDGRTIKLVSQNVDVNNLVQRAVGNSERFIMQRGQTLQLNLAKGLPLVKCDVERMIQAIGNVIGNAIKFTPDKGKIIVRTKLVHRSRLPQKFAANDTDGSCALSPQQTSYVEIAVCDKGIGIAASEQEAIFDKFYEIGDVEEHSTGKVAFKSRGAGLGLSIVKGIVDLHGGAVWVESPGYDAELLPGSTFYILLPVVDAIS